MQINEVAYKWAGQLTRRTATRRIILHHAAAVTCTPQQVHQWHLANGWTGIGYHFFVRKDGTVYRGRPEDTVGAHAGNNNYDSLGVCFEGSFDRETMPDAQLRAGQELVAYLKQKYGISTVQRHSDVNATGCPGDNFPFDALAGAQTAKPAVPAPVISGTTLTLPLRHGVLLAAIVREGRTIIPGGMTTIEPGDHVLVVTNVPGLTDLKNILA